MLFLSCLYRPLKPRRVPGSATAQGACALLYRYYGTSTNTTTIVGHPCSALAPRPTVHRQKEELHNHGCCASEIDDAKPEDNPLLPLGTEAVALSVQPPQVATSEGVSRAHGLSLVGLDIPVLPHEEVLHEETLRVVV